MKLQLERPLVSFDIEAAGLDITNDRIIELTILKLMSDGERIVRTRRFNPEMPIPAENTAIHGITDDDVRDCPPFKACAKSLAELIDGCDLVDCNSQRFGLPMLGEEFLRAGVGVDLLAMQHIDAQTISHEIEPRTLEGTVRFYCHREHIGTHGAEADTITTPDVLMAQLDKYSDELLHNVKELSDLTTYHRNMDLSGRVVLDDSDVPVFNFGERRGRSVEEAFRQEPGYPSWLMRVDFLRGTKRQFLPIKERVKP